MSVCVYIHLYVYVCVYLHTKPPPCIITGISDFPSKNCSYVVYLKLIQCYKSIISQ